MSQLALDLGRMIELARQQIAQTANAALTTLYWQLGKRVQTEILASQRAEYGAQIVAALGRQLESRYGRGFGEKNLRRMVQFAETFPDERIVAALRRQLGWAHFKLLIPIKASIRREFYAEMCRIHGWSTRALAEKIDGMLYERTALSRKPDELVTQELAALRDHDHLTPSLVFQDPAAPRQSLLEEVKRFDAAARAGHYYESFNVNSKNHMDKSAGTLAFIANFTRLLDRSVTASTTGDLVEVRVVMETLFALHRYIDECNDDVIFFADEGGAWQICVDWRSVLPAWFRCLGQTADAPEFARLVDEAIREFDPHSRSTQLAAAHQIATPPQRRALAVRKSSRAARM